MTKIYNIYIQTPFYLLFVMRTITQMRVKDISAATYVSVRFGSAAKIVIRRIHVNSGDQDEIRKYMYYRPE